MRPAKQGTATRISFEKGAFLGVLGMLIKMWVLYRTYSSMKMRQTISWNRTLIDHKLEAVLIAASKDIPRKHFFLDVISDKCDNCLQLGKPVFGRFNFRPSSGYTTEGISCIHMYHQWSTSINKCEDMISYPTQKLQLFSKGSLIPLMGWQDTSTVACSACLPGLHATDWGWGWTACPEMKPTGWLFHRSLFAFRISILRENCGRGWNRQPTDGGFDVSQVGFSLLWDEFWSGRPTQLASDYL